MVGGAVDELFAERERDAEQREQDAGELGDRDALMSDQRGEQQRCQREGREDQRAAPGRHGLQPVVQQRDQNAELADAEQRDRRDIASGKAHAPRKGERRNQTRNADRIAYERERRRRDRAGDETRRRDRGADLHARDGGGENRERGTVHRILHMI
jgi:hypothetical protein